MKKIWLIIQREYWVRVRKPTFIVMTLLGPIFIAAIYAVPIYLAMQDTDTRTIQVLDESKLLADKLKSNAKLKFVSLGEVSLQQAQAAYKESQDYALLYVPKLNLDKPEGIKLYSKKNISFEIATDIQGMAEKELENIKLIQAGIDPELLAKTDLKVKVDTQLLSEEGEKSSNVWATFGVGMVGALFLYASLFIYGVQVMRGVIEEKTNRIIEVIISSVKPLELMLGKIIGVGLVGLTQFLIWTVLAGVLTTASAQLLVDKQKIEQRQKENLEKQDLEEQVEKGITPKATSPLDFLQSFNIPLLIGSFIFYFLGGYLLYSALFAAIGSAVDAETDTQQFMLPITAPIIFSIVVAQFVARDPDGPLAFWLSMLPFTSPVIMMVRLPFGVDTWQLLLSMALLVAGFIGTTWVAARIYRIGVLMYGKKVTYKELYKWMLYRA
jgi:ABC-2 type transport system permease protein